MIFALGILCFHVVTHGSSREPLARTEHILCAGRRSGCSSGASSHLGITQSHEAEVLTAPSHSTGN